MSDRLSISRGCRQDCPLSPLLFSLVIEPLAFAVRTNTNIHGIKISLDEHCISLYADDVLFYLKYPETSTDTIIAVIKKYSNFSGYKINLDKSQALYLYVPSEAITKSPFNLALSEFQYLGINVMPNFVDLYKASYPQLITKIYQNLSDW